MTQVAARADEAVEDATTPASRRPLVAVLGAAAAFYAGFIWRTSWVVDGRRQFTLFDDAMISLTYARTLADGHGLVWYPGAPRVEGFTNPLWVGVMAVLQALGLRGSALSLVVMTLGAALCLASALLAVGILRRLTATTPGLDAAVAGLVAFSYPLVYWSLRGMEVGLVTALALGAVLLALDLDERRDHAPGTGRGRDLALGVVLAVGVTTRLDFAVIAGALLAWCWWRARPGRRMRAVVVPGAVAGAALVVQELARHAYYGRWVPNTFVLKTGGVPLLDRLVRGGWVAAAVVVGSLAAAAVLVVASRRRGALHRPAGVGLLMVVTGALLAYSWWAGGDAWEWMAHANRYLAPAVVLAGIAGTTAVADLLRRPDGVEGQARIVTAAALAAVLGPWLAFGVLAAGGLHPTARVDLESSDLVVLLALVGILALLAARRVAGAVATGPPPRAAVTVVVVLTVGAALLPVLQWTADAGAYVALDRHATELGLALAEVTHPDATIAVVAAGAPAFYSGRPAHDLLGKSDAHIAALPSREPFLPGHTKWDYPYSLGEVRPDVVAEVFRPTTADLDLLHAEGYELMVVDQEVTDRTLVVYVRSDSTRVDRSRLTPAGPELVEDFEGAVVGDRSR